jgi:hypothetical protein
VLTIGDGGNIRHCGWRVIQFNKRVKDADPLWSETGVEPILASRAPWLSQNDRRTRHRNTRPHDANAAGSAHAHGAEPGSFLSGRASRISRILPG